VPRFPASMISGRGPVGCIINQLNYIVSLRALLLILLGGGTHYCLVRLSGEIILRWRVDYPGCNYVVLIMCLGVFGCCSWLGFYRFFYLGLVPSGAVGVNSSLK